MDPRGEAVATAHGLTWDSIGGDITAAVDLITRRSGLALEELRAFGQALDACARVYERTRGADLWKVCEGKQVLRTIARRLGFANAEALELAALTIWEETPHLVPDELRQLRLYVEQL